MDNNGSCRGCGKPIIWIKTKAGKNMPCNSKMVEYWEKPGADGKVVTLGGDVVSCEFEGNPEDMTGWGYISHFATCTKAQTFRRRK